MGLTLPVLFLSAFVLLLARPAASFLVDEVKEDVVTQLKTAWKHIKAVRRDEKTTGEILEELAHVMKRIPDTISRAEKELLVFEYDEALKSLSKIHNTSTEGWKKKWSDIQILSSTIDVLYGHFKIFQDMPEALLPDSKIIPDYDATTLADIILAPHFNPDDKGTLNLRYLLDHSHSLTVHGGKNAFTLLSEHVEDALKHSYWCLWNGKTPQRVIYGFYVHLITTDIKEYVLFNFASMIRFALNNTHNQTNLEDAFISLGRRHYEKAAAAKTAISGASPGFWKCDPKEYAEGENFEAFKELLQGYIENEGDMHPKGSCKQSCGDFTYIKAKCKYQDTKTCLKHRICTGNLVNCDYIAADAKVCKADAPRRFDYVDYKSGPFLGKDGKCGGETVRKDSYWPIPFFYHCSNCFCLCDDPNSPTTVRHISLASVTADVNAKKIVSGIRLRMKNGILHIQIEEGTPERNGLISARSTNWQSLPNLSKSDKDSVEKLDYIHRAFDLDDVIVPSEHVVTGVRFRKLGAHFNLEVQATQINPLTTELLPHTSHWISNDNTPEVSTKPRKLLSIEDPDVPTLTKLPSVPDSAHDQYLQFGPSSRGKDVAQTTIPYLDTQDVRPNPPLWLQGVGFYHKGQPGYGGFISPRVFSKNAADFMDLTE